MLYPFLNMSLTTLLCKHSLSSPAQRHHKNGPLFIFACLMSRHSKNACLNKINSFGEFDLNGHMDPALARFQKVQTTCSRSRTWPASDLARSPCSRSRFSAICGHNQATWQSLQHMAFLAQQLKVMVLICTSSEWLGLLYLVTPSLDVSPSIYGHDLHVQTPSFPYQPTAPKIKLKSLSQVGICDPLSFKTALGVSNKFFTFWRGKSMLFIISAYYNHKCSPFRAAQTVNNNNIFIAW